MMNAVSTKIGKSMCPQQETSVLNESIYIGRQSRVSSPRNTEKVFAAYNVGLAMLVMVSAAGLFFSDFSLFRVGDFAVTPYHISLPLAAVLSLLSFQTPPYDWFRRLRIWLLILLIEVMHVIIIGHVTDSEWQRSMAQFLVYSFSFIAVSRMRLKQKELSILGAWAAWTGIVLSIGGVIQSILFRFGMPAYLPAQFRVRGIFDPLFDTYRYGGFSPALGLAMEPSYYAIALCTLLACVLFFNRAGILNRQLYTVALLSILSGILVSYSLSGIITAFVLLFSSLYTSTGKRVLVFIALCVLGWVLLGLDFTAPIRERLVRAMGGGDVSTLMRVSASLKLLFSNSSSLETALWGTGLGLEYREYETYMRVYLLAIPQDVDLNQIKIHNIFAVVRLLQGWIGILLYSIMVWFSIRSSMKARHIYVPLIVFFLVYHFSIGLYLAPAFWSVFALMTVLWQSELPARELVKS